MLDLDAIRARNEERRERLNAGVGGFIWHPPKEGDGPEDDIDALLAEVKRLQDWIDDSARNRMVRMSGCTVEGHGLSNPGNWDYL